MNVFVGCVNVFGGCVNVFGKFDGGPSGGNCDIGGGWGHCVYGG